MGNYVDEQTLIEINNLPSERWKVRRVHTAYDKELCRLYMEYRRVLDVIRNLGYEELNPPIQRGYKRLFVLTEDTKRNGKAGLYEGILDKLNSVWYSPVKTFQRVKKRKIAKWIFWKRREQRLRQPEDSEFKKTGQFTEEEKQLFTPVEYYSYGLRRWCVRYVFNEPWRFVLRVKPNIISQVRRKDLELEQYRDELSDRIDRNRGRMVKTLWGGNTNSWHTMEKKYITREKYKYNPIENKPLYEIMEEYKEEKEVWKYEQKI